jgi:hypothetical protein
MQSPLALLAAHFTSAQRFRFADFVALQDGVRPLTDVEPQAVEFLLDSQDFEQASGCSLGFRNERLQVVSRILSDTPSQRQRNILNAWNCGIALRLIALTVGQSCHQYVAPQSFSRSDTKPAPGALLRRLFAAAGQLPAEL